MFLFRTGVSQIPPGYYNQAAGLSGAALKTALHKIIRGHTRYSYDYLWTSFVTTDDKPNGKVWDIYSDIPDGTPNGNPPYVFTFITNQCATTPGYEGACYNREHSFPKSWFGAVLSDTMYSDMFHLYPTDSKVNSMRNNNPYGQVGTASWTSMNGSKLGTCITPGYTGTVFEPRDDFKGDIARSYFYMATRYESCIASWQTNTGADAVLDGTSYPCYDQWFIDLLLAWNVADPVSQKEIDRNNEIYTTYQHNRNPYIDHPEYVGVVWGPVVIKAEPTSHPTNFTAVAGSPAYSAIALSWTDAIGTVLPDGYLIKGSTVSFAAITDPVDGTAVADGGLNKNVGTGVQTYSFTGLNASTAYYFKIYSYTNTGLNINYKTLPLPIQSASLVTGANTGTGTLQAGDIAIIEVNSTDPDRVSFVAFKQIDAGTVINFTDNGYSDVNTVRTGEGFLIYTAPSTIAAGTVVSWYSGMTMAGTGWSAGSGSFSLSTNGDQVFAFLGTWGGGHTLLYGVNTGTNSAWLITGATATSNTSFLPAVLTDHVNALVLQANNCNYNLITGGTTNALGSLIAYPSNWATSSSNIPTPSWNFSVNTITTISQNAAVEDILIGAGETLTISATKHFIVNGTLTNIAGQ